MGRHDSGLCARAQEHAGRRLLWVSAVGRVLSIAAPGCSGAERRGNMTRSEITWGTLTRWIGCTSDPQLVRRGTGASASLLWLRPLT